MGIRLEKNWEILDSARIKALPGQLGVYQIADEDEQIISVGYAGAKEPFGIRSALEREILLHGNVATQFRYEFTSNYQSK